MNPDTTFEAHLADLIFLASIFLLALGLVIVMASHLKKKTQLRRILLKGILSYVAAYLGVLFAFSAISREKVLAPGVEKHFCEMDCHLAYSITTVHRTSTLGSASARRTIAGWFYVVTVRTRFDEHTIAPWRGNGLLYPGPRLIALKDEHGREYLPLANTSDLLRTDSRPFTQPLRPGESFETVLTFEVPKDVYNPELLITEEKWPNRLIIGQENSLFHGKTLFRLDTDASLALNE